MSDPADSRPQIALLGTMVAADTAAGLVLAGIGLSQDIPALVITGFALLVLGIGVAIWVMVLINRSDR